MNDTTERIDLYTVAISISIALCLTLFFLSCNSPQDLAASPEDEGEIQIIREWNYEEDRIFDLGFDTEFAPGDLVVNLQVYQERPIGDTAFESYARFYVRPKDTLFRKAENFSIDSTPVVHIKKQYYIWRNDSSKTIPYVVFTKQAIHGMLGVWMVIYRHTSGTFDTIGTITNMGTYKLKLIHPRPERAAPSDTTWSLMWRNCYSLSRDSLSVLKLKIYKGLPGNEGMDIDLDYQESRAANNRFIMITGLDQFNVANELYPDGLLDTRPEIFRPEWGLLIFPQRRPFSPDSCAFIYTGRTTTYPNDSIQFRTSSGILAPRLKVQVPEIYDSKVERQSATQYYLRIATTTPHKE